ncbi:MAG: hypothetical protein AAFY17_08800 [Cyanobacteria bacterium J06642_11]
MKQYFREKDNFIYTESHCHYADEFRIWRTEDKAKFLINRVIALYWFSPNKIGLVYENPETDGYSVSVDTDNLGYCGNRIGTFDYCENLVASLSKLESVMTTKGVAVNYRQEAASQIWELSEKLNIPLGEFAEPVFAAMVRREGIEAIQNA